MAEEVFDVCKWSEENEELAKRAYERFKRERSED